VAKYDLVSTRDGRATIYDWKTYARRPSDEWLAARWQTRVYRALLSRAGAVLNDGRPFDPTRIRMIYWFADFPDEPAEFIYDEQQFSADWSAVESLLKEIESTRDFPLTEDEGRCRFCEFRSLCDRGGRAGPWQDVDVETPESAAIGVDFEQIIEAEY
jgi:hypothetical protein